MSNPDSDRDTISEVSQTKEPPRLIALASIAAGIYPLLLSLDIIPGGSESLNVPVWVGVVASSVFIIAGFALLTRKIKWLNQLFGISILVLFAIIGNWIAFGVGERTCEVSMFSISRESADLMCRIPFGYGAILINAIIIVFSLNYLGKKVSHKTTAKVMEKISGVVLLIALFPFLVFLVVPIIYKAIKSKF